MKIRRAEPEEVNVNLIPIMNLFTALIPFLLLSAAFFHMAVIQVAVPFVSDTDAEVVERQPQDALTLNVRITANHYQLSASSETVDPVELQKMTAVVTRMRGSEEVEAMTLRQLSEVAHTIKGRYTASTRALVMPDDDIPYEDVVAVLDAIREITIVFQGSAMRVPLFSQVILSSVEEE